MGCAVDPGMHTKAVPQSARCDLRNLPHCSLLQMLDLQVRLLTLGSRLPPDLYLQVAVNINIFKLHQHTLELEEQCQFHAAVHLVQ